MSAPDTKSLPLVSIVTPSFNQAAFLEQTIRSVLAQDYPNIEYIIMDGGSTDESVEILRRYEDRLASWVSQRDDGQSSAIRRGFALATGTILAWLNSDDLLAPSAVRIAVDALRRFSEAGLVYGDRLHIDAKGNIIGVNRMPAYYRSMLRRNITLPQETVFIRREVYEKVGGVDPAFRFSMDFDLWVRLSAMTNFRHVPAFLGCFREHATCKSISFHSPEQSDSQAFGCEHASVYRKHFGRPLPGKWRMKWNRWLHMAKLAAERFGPAYWREVACVRELTAQEYPTPVWV